MRASLQIVIAGDLHSKCDPAQIRFDDPQRFAGRSPQCLSKAAIVIEHLLFAHVFHPETRRLKHAGSVNRDAVLNPVETYDVNASMASATTTAGFILPMLLLKKERLPEGPEWLYELKLDGYRALAITDNSPCNRHSWVA